MSRSWLADDLMVKNPQAKWRLLIVILGLMVFGWVWLMLAVNAPKPWSTIGTGVLGGFIGWSCMSIHKKQLAYRSGWLAGRHQMIDALREASERELSLADWLDLELERDARMLGLTVPSRREQDGT